MYRVDLHTHSTASPDGGITAEQYAELLNDGTLDFVAITDHNTIALAQDLQKTFGPKIIIGEEITTAQGEVIGLFLTEPIQPNLPLSDTVKAIRAQGGLVYAPHPFETVRKGIQEKDLLSVVEDIDIVEVYNGRAVAQNKGPKAAVWARLHHKAPAAASDAHGYKGVGTAFTTLKEEPSAINLVSLLGFGHLTTRRPPLKTLLYPKLHRLRHKLGKA